MNLMWSIVFFLLPLVGCGYVGWHIWTILPLPVWCKWTVLIVLAVCFLCMFLNLMVGLDSMPPLLARVMYEVGFSSIFVLLYLVMIFLLLDLGRLLHLVPVSFLHQSAVGSVTLLTVMLGIFIYGNLYYYNKVRVPIYLNTDKPLARDYKLVMISDLHLGYHNTRDDLAKWVDLINAEHADAVFIAGDIVDFSVVPIIRTGMAREFRRLNAPVYASLGNHDYYAGAPNSEKFYKDAGIVLLKDRNIIFKNDISVIGRDDRTNGRRANLETLTGKTDMNRFSVLLDHQPYNLECAERNNVDFQFSGHTHYGQVWPVSWIEDAIYEDAFGPLKKGNTRYYVSSGIGIWGGKFRIGTRSEYCVVYLKSSKKRQK